MGEEQEVKRREEPQTTAITPVFLEGLAANPEVSPEKLRQFLDMRHEEEDRIAKRLFMEAMARVQEQIPIVLKDKDNAQTNSKYASEEAIARAIRPVYSKEGFSISYGTEDSPRENHMRVVAYLRHAAGHEEKLHLDYPYDDRGIKGNANKTMIHAYKSTISYAKSTLVCMAFNVATGEDDDGNAAGVGETIDETDQTAIEKLLKDCDADRKHFLLWLEKQGIDGIENIPIEKVEWITKMILKSAENRKAQQEDPV